MVKIYLGFCFQNLSFKLSIYYPNYEILCSIVWYAKVRGPIYWPFRKYYFTKIENRFHKIWFCLFFKCSAVAIMQQFADYIFMMEFSLNVLHNFSPASGFLYTWRMNISSAEWTLGESIDRFNWRLFSPLLMKWGNYWWANTACPLSPSINHTPIRHGQHFLCA